MSAARSRELCIMACVFCKDALFRRWLALHLGPDETITEAEAKDCILILCEISSRNELDTNPRAAAMFHEKVRRPFVEWKAKQEVAA